MHEGGFFFQAFIYLTAAVLSVPVAKKLGLGSVLGYLIAGIMIGPFVLGLVGREGQDVMHFAEFGVVMMLFLIGLELQPSVLWKLKGPILGMGGLQVVLTAAAIMAVALILGLHWQMSLAIGLTLALSSTAIVLQTLNEKGLINTQGGQNSFSVLLFQDIAVIPILAFLPLLASENTAKRCPGCSVSPDLDRAVTTLGRNPGDRCRHSINYTCRKIPDQSFFPINRPDKVTGNFYGSGSAPGHRHRFTDDQCRFKPGPGNFSCRCCSGPE